MPFGGLPTAYPYTLMISQEVTEAVLLERLTELGGRVLRPYTATSIEQDGEGVTGITDAVALAQALDAVLAGGSPELLDAYGADRRPVAQKVVALADRLTRLATADRRVRPLRNLVLRSLARIPAFRRGFAWRLSGLVYR
ncbi:FAD-dependent oxidoreductase [Sphaerisporangium perillae]|uniref:FAD-dependent oxidoreductase n=1 Tax=Sphaerisporangium perillae TaxID=2935860 RepID=UPI00200FB7DD|nr:FAD-dependent monooxygenase [Sphaerisporangium perillae]